MKNHREIEQLKNKTITLENKNTPFLFMALIEPTNKSVSQILYWIATLCEVVGISWWLFFLPPSTKHPFRLSCHSFGTRGKEKKILSFFCHHRCPTFTAYPLIRMLLQTNNLYGPKRVSHFIYRTVDCGWKQWKMRFALRWLGIGAEQQIKWKSIKLWNIY